MNLPSGESLVRQIVHGQRYFQEHFGVDVHRGLDPRRVRLPGRPAADLRRGRDAPVRHPEAVVEPHQPIPASHVLVGGHRRQPRAHALPAGRHLRRRDHAEGAGLLGRAVRRARVERLVARAVRLRRRRRRADPRDARARATGWPTSTACPTSSSVRRATFFDHVEAEAAGGAPVPVWRGELYFETHRGTLTSQLRTKLGNRRCEKLLRELELWDTTAARGRGERRSARARRRVARGADAAVPRHPPGSSIAWVHDDAEEIFEPGRRRPRTAHRRRGSATCAGGGVVANVATAGRTRWWPSSPRRPGEGPCSARRRPSRLCVVGAPGLAIAPAGRVHRATTGSSSPTGRWPTARWP